MVGDVNLFFSENQEDGPKYTCAEIDIMIAGVFTLFTLNVLRIKCIIPNHSLVPRPYFFLLLSLFINIEANRQNEAAKKEMGVQLRKSKAWFGKSRDPQGFL